MIEGLSKTPSGLPEAAEVQNRNRKLHQSRLSVGEPLEAMQTQTETLTNKAAPQPRRLDEKQAVA